MGVYDRPIATAKRLIDKYGEPCVWRKFNVASGTQDWNEQASGPDDYTDYPVTVAIFPYDRQSASALAKLAGLSDIERYDMYGLMPAVAFAVESRDLLISPTRGPLRPVRLDPLQPGSDVVMYTLGLSG